MITLEQQLIDRLAAQGAAPWRVRLARWIESPRVVGFIIGVILINAVVLGLETDKDLMARSGTLLFVLDKACLAVFLAEITCKLLAFMAIFFYTAAVLATNLFGAAFPTWFGTIGRSLFSLFQIMTLESWSMGIVRPVMEQFPYAWSFFVPFIILATFTILNLFIGIIVSTMQELSNLPEPGIPKKDLAEALARIEGDIQGLRRQIENEPRA